MKLTTYTDLPSGREITHKEKILMFGSCFSENMGLKLKEGKFDCRINPYGTLYNPLSIARAMEEIICGKVYTAADLTERDGRWHSMMHHSDYSGNSPEDVLEKINSSIRETREELPHTDILILTFGSARVYENERGVVGNCHKFPEVCFSRRLISAREIISTWEGLFLKLKEINPGLRTIITVSPIRHIRDGLTGNSVSKAVLRIAAEELTRENECREYFPSYEIMIDELRDYRFYAEDLVHPTPTAVEYIWEKFSETYLSPHTRQIAAEWRKIEKGLSHRASENNSSGYYDFLNHIMTRIEDFHKKYPYIAVDKELKKCQKQLRLIK